MSDKFFESEFNIEDYVTKRMLEIKSLDDRIVYKDIAKHMVIELYKYHETCYQNLCNNIMDDIKSEAFICPIYIGITKRNDYDETDLLLSPIKETDKEIKKIICSDMIESLEANLNYNIGTMYLNIDYINLKKFKDKQQFFNGIITTDNGEYSAVFSVEHNSSYLDELSELYHTFEFNQKKWFTVCTAYLQRFFILSVCKINGEKPEGKFVDFKIDFLEYETFILEDMFPLWNMCKRIELTSSYPKPAKDKIRFEHKIFDHVLNPSATYLVTRNNPVVSNVTRVKGDLIIKGEQSEAIEWELLEIKEILTNKYKYEILSNEYAITNTDHLLNHYKSSIKTKGEIQRFLKNLPYGEYLSVKSIEVLSNRNIKYDTYDVDFFIYNEIRTEPINSLVIFFEQTQEKHTFIYDFISFYLTHIQKIFPEYKCVGKLI